MTVEWQEDGVHHHPATKYSKEALRAAAKEKGIKLSRAGENGKRVTLTKSELIDELISAGELFPEAKAKRAPSAYNLFMKNQIKRIYDEEEKGDLKHTDIFRLAAENYRKLHPAVEKPVKEKVVKDKKKRGPSKYNDWVSAQIKRIREEEPETNAKLAFKKAVDNYKKKNAEQVVLFPKQRKLFS
jgi:hypothetical protein